MDNLKTIEGIVGDSSNIKSLVIFSNAVEFDNKMPKSEIISVEMVANRIRIIRNQKVILDYESSFNQSKKEDVA